MTTETAGKGFYQSYEKGSNSKFTLQSNTSSDSNHTIVLDSADGALTSIDAAEKFQLFAYAATYARNSGTADAPAAEISNNKVYIKLGSGETLRLSGGGSATQWASPGTGALMGTLLGANGIIQADEGASESYGFVHGGTITLSDSLVAIDGGGSDSAQGGTVTTGLISGTVINVLYKSNATSRGNSSLAETNSDVYIQNAVIDFYNGDDGDPTADETWNGRYEPSQANADRGILAGLTVLKTNATNALYHSFQGNDVVVSNSRIEDAWRIGGVVFATNSNSDTSGRALENSVRIESSTVNVRTFKSSVTTNTSTGATEKVGNYDYAVIAGVDNMMAKEPGTDPSGQSQESLIKGNAVSILNSTVDNPSSTQYPLHIAGAYFGGANNENNGVEIVDSMVNSPDGDIYGTAGFRNDSGSSVSIQGASSVTTGNVAGSLLEINQVNAAEETMTYALKGIRVDVGGDNAADSSVALATNTISAVRLDYVHYRNTSSTPVNKAGVFTVSDTTVSLANTKTSANRIGIFDQYLSQSSTYVTFDKIATTYEISNNTLQIGPNVTEMDGSRLTLTKLGTDVSSKRLSGITYHETGNTLVLASPVTTASFSGFDNWVFVYGPDTADGIADTTQPALIVNGTDATTVATGSESAPAGSISVVLNGLEPAGEIVLVQNEKGFVDADGAALTDEALANMKASDFSLERYKSLALLESLSPDDVTLALRDNVGDDGLMDSIVIVPDSGSGQGGGASTNNSPFGEVFSQQSLSRLAGIIASDDLLVDTLSHHDFTGGNWFAAARYNGVEFNTGSSVEDKTFSSLIGAGFPLTDTITVGAFFEAGASNVKTHKSASIGSIEGDGDNDYYGAGVFLTAERIADTGLFARAYLKAGNMDSDFTVSNAVTGPLSNSTSHLYVAANVTAGYSWNLTDTHEVRLQAAYFYDRLKSDDFGLTEANGAASRIRADDTYAHRLELMAKWIGHYEGFTPFAGLGLETIPDSSAKGTVTSVSTDGLSASIPFVESDVEGESAVGELGAALKMNAWTLKAYLKGYAGQREGLAGSLDVRYTF